MASEAVTPIVNSMTASPTTGCRRHQAELESAIDHMAALLDGSDPGDIAADLRAAVAILSVKLAQHLARQDDALYPRLCYHPDEEVRHTARSSQDDLSTLRRDVERFAAAWSSAPLIAVRYPAFSAQARAVLGRLSSRLRHEGEALYPMADRLGSDRFGAN